MTCYIQSPLTEIAQLGVSFQLKISTQQFSWWLFLVLSYHLWLNLINWFLCESVHNTALSTTVFNIMSAYFSYPLDPLFTSSIRRQINFKCHNLYFQHTNVSFKNLSNLKEILWNSEFFTYLHQLKGHVIQMRWDISQSNLLLFGTFWECYK